MQSDERLMALVRQGHERAFEALVLRYRRPLLAYCRRLGLCEARAEDVLQLALLKSWIALREGAEVRQLKAWLYRIVHNTALNARRGAERHAERLTDPTQLGGISEPALDQGLRAREALAAVGTLPKLQREAIVRTAMAGHSHERVADDLGISQGALRGLVYRARATLRAAVTALTPPPVLQWLAGTGATPSSERLLGIAAGGSAAGAAGAAGAGGLLVKGGVVALTAGALITGVVAHIHSHSHSHARDGYAPPGRSAGADPGGARGQDRAAVTRTELASASVPLARLGAGGRTDAGAGRYGAAGRHARGSRTGTAVHGGAPGSEGATVGGAADGGGGGVRAPAARRLGAGRPRSAMGRAGSSPASPEDVQGDGGGRGGDGSGDRARSGGGPGSPSGAPGVPDAGGRTGGGSPPRSSSGATGTMAAAPGSHGGGDDTEGNGGSERDGGSGLGLGGSGGGSGAGTAPPADGEPSRRSEGMGGGAERPDVTRCDSATVCSSPSQPTSALVSPNN